MSVQRAAKELELWNAWKKTGNKRTLSSLLDSFRPMIGGVVNKFRPAHLPPSAVEAEAMSQAINAFGSYNPKSGAALGTHVYNNLKRVQRFVVERQNIGRIPDHRSLQVGTYNTVKTDLSEQLGREPSALELSDELNWSPAEVERISKELRREVPESNLISDFSFNRVTPEQKVLSYIYYELSPQEKTAFEYLTGWGGKPKLSDADIAKRVGVSRDRIRRIKANISNKIKEHM